MGSLANNKGFWIQRGLEYEDFFCEHVAPRVNLHAEINPDKAENKYAPDLMVNTNILADLKVQRMPFYSSTGYGFNPDRTVTFNKKDLVRYLSFYPEILVIFHVDFYSTKGIWLADIPLIQKLIAEGKSVEHVYKSRVSDPSSNGKSSYLLSLDDLLPAGLLR